MGGGELQLIQKGNMDEYLTVNPEVSFYQYVYKRHTNFALDSRILTFDANPVLSLSADGSYRCKISRYGDLLSDLYFCFTLPEIYSSDKYKFRWVKNVGTVFIKEAIISMGNIELDRITGEWMNIWNELVLPAGDTKFDTLIGNAPEMQDPKSSFPRVSIKNNRFIYFYYPETDKNSPVPSISSRQIIVPLRFWFTRNPALALPLFKLRGYEVYVTLKLETSEKLYQVYSDKLDMYISPTYYNELSSLHEGDTINISSFVKSRVDLLPYIEVNYVYLDNDELRELSLRSTLTYLAEQLTVTTVTNVSSQNINLLVNNPVKELIWVVKRDDLWKYNDYFNFSANIPESNNGLLNTAIITFNDKERIEEKNAEYFNMIQPYQHHTKIPKQGIYCYSFALFPEKEFLSGYYNAGLVKTKLRVRLKDTYDNLYVNSKLLKNGIEPYNVSYNVVIYTLNYNIFEVVGAQAGMKFTVST